MTHYMKEEVSGINGLINVNYLKKNYPNVSIDNIINELNLEYDFQVKNPNTNNYEKLTQINLTDKKYWLSNLFFDKFYKKIIEKTNNPGIGYAMGRESILIKGLLSFYGLLNSVTGLIDKMPNQLKKWNHTKDGIVIENKKGYFKFALKHKPDIIVSDFAVDYHLGIFDALAEASGLVGFETQLTYSDKEKNYYEFEGKYEYESRFKRTLNKLVSKYPYVKRSLDVSRSNSIKHRDAEIRERILKEKESSRKKRLGVFVSPRTLEHCIDRDLEPELGLNEEYKSILFSDIRNFTEMSEKLDKKILASLLNDYLNTLSKPVEQHNGWVDKYIGDAIMAFFNTGYDAVLCGIDMRPNLRKFNDKIAKNTDYSNVGQIHSGVGIATGVVLLGNIGSKTRMDYSVIGDKVNLGSRLEGLTKQYKIPIIIDEETYQEIKTKNKLFEMTIENSSDIKDLKILKNEIKQQITQGKIFTREIDLVRPKGKKDEITIYEVMNSYSLNVLLLRMLDVKNYETAKELSRCKSQKLNEIKSSLEESINLFTNINENFKSKYSQLIKLNSLEKWEYEFLHENQGDFICQENITRNKDFLNMIKINPAFFEKRDWYVRNFDEK